MTTIDQLLNEPVTEQEIKSALHTINTLLGNSTGEQRELRLKKKKELQGQLDIIQNPKPEDIIVIDMEEISPRTIEMDTYDIRDLEIKAVKAPRTANEILAERDEHKFISSLYRESSDVNISAHPMESIFIGLAGCY
jgi:hypothetical protein